MPSRKKRIDFDALRNIPIIEVAELLGMDLKIQNSHTGEWVMKDPAQVNGISSLVIFEKNNKWKRFSGKTINGVSQGSTIDLVMHIKGYDLTEAAHFLKQNLL